jgi:hypothetical protein
MAIAGMILLAIASTTQAQAAPGLAVVQGLAADFVGSVVWRFEADGDAAVLRLPFHALARLS